MASRARLVHGEHVRRRIWVALAWYLLLAERAVARRLVIVVAWVWLGESLDLPQLSGAAATLAGISPAQTPR